MSNAPDKIYASDESGCSVYGYWVAVDEEDTVEYIRTDLYQAQYDRAEQNGFNHVMAKEHLHLAELDFEQKISDLVAPQMTDEEIREAFEEFFSTGPRNTKLYRRDVEAPEEYFVEFIQERFWGWKAAFEFMQQRMRKRNG